MHQLRIKDGIIYLDDKEIRGVKRYKVKGSAEDGKTAEITLRMDVILAGIELEPEK